MTIGERIKKRREELSLSQAALAERMGYKSRAAICSVEKDKEDPTTARIRKFAEALETTPAYLMGWEDENGMAIDSADRQSLASDLYEKYQNAAPEIRSAVDLLLKSQKPET